VLLVMPADTAHPLQVVDKLLTPPPIAVSGGGANGSSGGSGGSSGSSAQQQQQQQQQRQAAYGALVASESQLPLRDPLLAKHYVLLQDVGSMDDGRWGRSVCACVFGRGGGRGAAGRVVVCCVTRVCVCVGLSG
jgi:hypothetical protein